MSDLNREEKDILYSWAFEFGVTLSDFQIGLFAVFLDELWEWNSSFNLTGLSSKHQIIEEVLLDSLIPAAYLPEECTLLDVGSGGGFPGIPLKICLPQSRITLMEANQRKVNFLKHAIRLTKLKGIRVIRGRIEKDLSPSDNEGYDVITARAMADLCQTLTWCAPYVRKGGLVVNFQGRHFQDTINSSSDVMKKCRFSLHKSIRYTLPGKTFMRHVLIFKRYEH